MKRKICAWCYYARMKTDICGIYCTGGFENPDGTCDHFRDSREGLTERTVSMETDKLIEALEYAAKECDRTNYGCQWSSKLLEAVTALRAQDAQLAEKDKRLAAAVKCIADVETYLNLGSAKYIKRTIELWRGPQEAEEGGG